MISFQWLEMERKTHFWFNTSTYHKGSLISGCEMSLLSSIYFFICAEYFWWRNSIQFYYSRPLLLMFIVFRSLHFVCQMESIENMKGKFMLLTFPNCFPNFCLWKNFKSRHENNGGNKIIKIIARIFPNFFLPSNAKWVTILSLTFHFDAPNLSLNYHN
jgi:hypothetical protein